MDATQLPDWARTLDLEPHPEGGWYRETWRSDVVLPGAALPPRYDGERNAATAILYLLLPGEESAWHAVASDEVWLHHRGGPLVLDLLSADLPEDVPDRLVIGTREVVLGPDLDAGEQPQIVVPGGTWQHARPAGPEPALVSCVVAPGFDARDFTLLRG